MATHTHGPWKLDGGIGPKGERYVWTDRDEDGKGYIGTHEVCVAIVGGKRYMGESRDTMATIEEIILADAQLIAAAPELLAALEAVLDGQIGGQPDMNAERFTMARAAIAKARGES